MTKRRLFTLVSQFPADSRTKSRLRGDDAGRRWSEATYLLADIHELLQILRSEQLAVAPFERKDRPKIPELQRVPRPGDDTEAEQPAQHEDADRFQAIQKYLATLAPPPG